MIERLRSFVVVLLAVPFWACATALAQAPGEPETVAAEGPYVHSATGMTFPLEVAGFNRDRILRYDKKGLDVSAGYNSSDLIRPVAATVYIFPAPSLISIGSSRETVEPARALLTQRGFDLVKAAIVDAHPDAKLVEEGEASLTQGGKTYRGKRAAFEFREFLATARSEVYVFYYVGEKWTIKYRFTYPKDADVGKQIEAFMMALQWPALRP